MPTPIITVDQIPYIEQHCRLELNKTISHIAYGWTRQAIRSFSKDMQLDLIKGKPTEAFGRELTFTGWEPFDNGNKYHFNIYLQGEL